MEGMGRAANRQLDLAIVTSWHTASFALSGYAGKLKDKKLSDFLSTASKPRAEDRQLKNAKAIHFFHSAKARGLPIDITRAN